MEKTKINDSSRDPRNRILISTPTLGVIRAEWAAARWGQVIPCNWSNSSIQAGVNSHLPIRYLVADAQNLAVQEAVQKDFEWLLLHEDDVVLPPDAFLKLNEYMRKADVPVVSGLYYTKSDPSEPVVYRGRGNSYFDGWKRGDKVWADGVPTGCLLIHCSILKLMYEDSEEYQLFNGTTARKVFETPGRVWTDPETGASQSEVGTSDLAWCDRVIDKGYLKRAGWAKVGRRKYPFLVDTNIFCTHIDLSSGKQYPQ